MLLSWIRIGHAVRLNKLSQVLPLEIQISCVCLVCTIDVIYNIYLLHSSELTATCTFTKMNRHKMEISQHKNKIVVQIGT